MKPIKLVVIAIVILGALSLSAAAQPETKSLKPTSPRSVVANLYKQHKKRSPFFQTKSRALLDQYFTRQLANLLWQDARTSGDEVGALEGDPLYNAQDVEIKDFSLHEVIVGNERAEVSASFKNFGENHQIVFQLVLVRGTWKIADIKYDDGSTLLRILKSDKDAARQGQSIKVFLVALNDNGKTGKKIGCGDSLVPVTQTIEKTAAPLTAAIRELLATPQHPDGSPKLENFWKGNNLKVTSAAIRNHTATIHISGEVFVAGVCDEPRIKSQIEATAKQFPAVKYVKVFIGKRTLADAIR